jgi:hypothetical protein
MNRDYADFFSCLRRTSYVASSILESTPSFRDCERRSSLFGWYCSGRLIGMVGFCELPIISPETCVWRRTQQQKTAALWTQSCTRGSARLGSLYNTEFLSSKYLLSASFQSGISIPYLSKLLLESTEYFGRCASRTKCSLVVGRTVVVSPETPTISRENSNHEQLSRLVACTIPLALARQSWTIARARSVV